MGESILECRNSRYLSGLRCAGLDTDDIGPDIRTVKQGPFTSLIYFVLISLIFVTQLHMIKPGYGCSKSYSEL